MRVPYMLANVTKDTACLITETIRNDVTIISVAINWIAIDKKYEQVLNHHNSKSRWIINGRFLKHKQLQKRRLCYLWHQSVNIPRSPYGWLTLILMWRNTSDFFSLRPDFLRILIKICHLNLTSTNKIIF